MKSIRKFVYASLLVLSAWSFAPTLASAQEAHGTFTLTHEVHWQNAVVPAGEYKFSIETRGPSQLLLLRQVGGGNAGFLMLASDTEPAATSEVSSLVVVKRAGQSFVSSMSLPQSGITLNFAVPAEAREVAQAGVATTVASNR